MKTFTAFYDLHYGPISYDFVVFLVHAMRHQAKAGCERLHVVLIPKEDGLGGFSRHWGGHDEAAARWRLWNIVIAACPLAGASVTLAADRAQASWLQKGPHWLPDGKAHFAGGLIEAARAGEKLPKLRATDAARRSVAAWLKDETQPVVTLTLRSQRTSDPGRNSNAPAWAEFGDWLDNRGYRVVRVQDTVDALETGQGYAELSIDLRLALYERAAMNCVGHNGPGALLWLSGAPMLQYGAMHPVEAHREHWAKYLKLQPPQQLPWATKDQRLVYRPDSVEVLKEEFQNWEVANRLG